MPLLADRAGRHPVRSDDDRSIDREKDAASGVGSAPRPPGDAPTDAIGPTGRPSEEVAQKKHQVTMI
jgi:hypothetical protein